jgi:hypothetical protein
MKRQQVVQGTLCATVPITVRVGIVPYVSAVLAVPRCGTDGRLDVDPRDLSVYPSGRLGTSSSSARRHPANPWYDVDP